MDEKTGDDDDGDICDESEEDIKVSATKSKMSMISITLRVSGVWDLYNYGGVLVCK